MGADPSDYSYLTVPNMVRGRCLTSLTCSPSSPTTFRRFTRCATSWSTPMRGCCSVSAHPAEARPRAARQIRPCGSTPSSRSAVAFAAPDGQKLVWPICKELDALARSIISSELGSLVDDGLGDWGLVDAST